MKIYTKTGDDGTTSLFGGKRIDKNDLRIEAYGTVDELNSIIGTALSEIKTREVRDALTKIQNTLFIIGSDLATPGDLKNSNKVLRLEQKSINDLESQIDSFNDRLPELKNFILPGGTKSASLLHLARTVCRRAERKVVELTKSIEISKNLIIYLNRLSDLLFVLARFENHSSNIPDVKWET